MSILGASGLALVNFPCALLRGAILLLRVSGARSCAFIRVGLRQEAASRRAVVRPEGAARLYTRAAPVTVREAAASLIIRQYATGLLALII